MVVTVAARSSNEEVGETGVDTSVEEAKVTPFGRRAPFVAFVWDLVVGEMMR